MTCHAGWPHRDGRWGRGAGGQLPRLRHPGACPQDLPTPARSALRPLPRDGETVTASRRERVTGGRPPDPRAW